jgi:hypothetical protein
MTISTRIDNPSFLNEGLFDHKGGASVGFTIWTTQTQQQINEAFSQLNQTLAGQFTTVAGSASQTIPVTGATSSDSAIVIVHTVGATPRSVVAAASATNQITVTMSGDPSNDHVLTWQLSKR